MKIKVDDKHKGMFDDEFLVVVNNIWWYAHQNEFSDQDHLKIYGYDEKSGSVFARYSGGNIEWFQTKLKPDRIILEFKDIK